VGVPAIRVEGLGKVYRLGERRPYETLRDSLAGIFKGTFRGAARDSKDEFLWALRDLSFEVGHGEVVGVIGRNGAGKSTLLKILSRITEPTTGEARISGRIGSLLEVGTGFHPELSGRENIHLNGAILGMRRAEIARKFDDIVAFAEVERFLDTAVKHYSSGMYVRLAFAVAAHLETEILLVDEVLAVGDARFQKKCLGKMGEIGRQGRTVLFVSHAMAAVQALCTRGLVLEAGRLDFDGRIDAAVGRYMSSGAGRAAVHDLSGVEGRGGSGGIRLTSLRIEGETGSPAATLPNGRACSFVLGYQVGEDGRLFDQVAATLSVRNALGARVFYHHNLLTGQPFDRVGGRGEFRLRIPRLPLSSGDYHADLQLSTDRGRTLLDAVEGVVVFEVCDGDFFGSGFEYRGGANAAVLVDGSWTHRQG
jgi:homopolymeric O-antigen transport system ATP-binding protein